MPRDEDLCLLAQQGKEEAAEILIRRHSRLVKSCARSYFMVGADAEDLLQEGMLGLVKAISDFDSTLQVPFDAFARLCVTRSIQTAIRAASAQKHTPLNQSMSIDRPLFEDLAKSRSDSSVPLPDPEALVIGNEERKELMCQLYAALSAFEAKVLTLFLEGYSYEQMAKKLQKPIKSVDNAIQRIKRKSASIKSN